MSLALRREQYVWTVGWKGEPYACTFFFHCHPKEEQAASCLGVGFLLWTHALVTLKLPGKAIQPRLLDNSLQALQMARSFAGEERIGGCHACLLLSAPLPCLLACSNLLSSP